MKKFLFLLSFATSALAQPAAPAADPLVFSPRRAVVLAGGSNFRDLGGYPAAGGQHVRWGRIYRSADISQLTEADLLKLQSLHLSTVCDLRGPIEYQQAPDRLPVGARRVELPAGSENVDPRRVLANSRLNADSLMRTSYTNISFFKAKYQPLFEQLLAQDDSQALLFHCTAGKDRTGIGAALVLAALGVDKSLILKDYAATDVFWQPAPGRLPAAVRGGGSPEANARARALRAANPAYLSQTFATIEQQYGSVNNYLVQVMELTPAKRAALRSKYLQ